MEGASLSELAQEGDPVLEEPNFRTTQAQQIFEEVTFGAEAWGRSYVRVVAVAEQSLAAAEVIQREAAGEIFVGLTETETTNPITGDRYLFDAESRELRVDSAYQNEHQNSLTVPPLLLSREDG